MSPPPDDRPAARHGQAAVEWRQHLRSAARRRTPVAPITLERSSAWLAVGAETVSTLLRADGAGVLAKAEPLDAVRMLTLGESLADLNGGAWQDARRAAAPGLTPRRLAGAVPVVARRFDALGAREELTFDHLASVVAASVVEFLFGTLGDEELEPVAAAVVEALAVAHDAVHHGRDAAAAAAVAAKRVRTALGDAASQAEPGSAARALSDGGSIGLLVGLVCPAVDNISQTLYWALHFLSGDAAARSQLQAERARVVGAVAGGAGSVEAVHFDDLVAHDAVIRETLRLAPPVVLIPRRTLVEVELSGVVLPAGALVVVCPWLNHRDPQQFPDPERFLPARWADGLGLRLPAGAYQPFGLGPRRCIGRAMATTVSVTALAALLGRVEPVARDSRGGDELAADPELDGPWCLRPATGAAIALRAV